MLCAQPGLPQLGNWMLDVYSGSSIATAVVSGAIVVLQSVSPGTNAEQAFAALRETASGAKMINVAAAAAYLRAQHAEPPPG